MDLFVDVLPLQLSEPFSSHKGTTERHIEHLLVRVLWQNLVGYGIAIPPKEDGKVGIRKLKDTLEQYIPILLNASSPYQLRDILYQLNKMNHLATLSAIDMALHDLLAKAYSHPLYKVLGLEGLPIPSTALSIGVMPEEEILKKVYRYQQWPILKLKMSLPNGNLLYRIRQIYSGRIWIDGNGAWTLEQAIEMAKYCSNNGIELIEQPIAKRNLPDLQKLRESTDILIIADEDCSTASDVILLANYADGINIKLHKCGGLLNAMNMITLAKQYDLKIMLGCKTESILGVTAIANLAGLADFIDLDGHLDILHDPFQGIEIEDGKLSLMNQPGLGVREHVEYLDKNSRLPPNTFGNPT